MHELESFDSPNAEPVKPRVRSLKIMCKTALSPSNLPGLDFALNPYFGCSHACVYCYAPYVLHQPRNDWGLMVKIKANIPEILDSEIKKKNGIVGIGTVTDPYQMEESNLQITRKCLAALLKSDIPISILTKSPLVTRDIDLFSRFRSVEVGITITTQFDDLAREFEPGAPPPSARFMAVKELVDAAIDTYVLIGPILPCVTDKDLDDFFSRIASTEVKRVMADRLRLRPGMLARLESLPMMRNERFKAQFLEYAQSDAYFYQIAERMRKLSNSYGIHYADAF